jgi:hypothetical protein
VQDGYRYHFFVSYSRVGDVPSWLRWHFLPVLRNCLAGMMVEDPQIFIDEQIDTGSEWPRTLAEALHRSCSLIAIWTPSYFRSKWCLAEWYSFRHREEALGYRTAKNPRGLIFPVLFSDGDCLPDEAKRAQHKDFRGFAYPYEVFRNSQKYLEFHDRMTEFAAELASNTEDFPAWDPAWKPARPAVKAPFAPRFRRL